MKTTLSFKCNFSPKIKANSEVSFCSVSTCSFGYLEGVLGVQSLLSDIFEIIQVIVNSSTQLPSHFLTMNFPSHTIIYFLQLCAAVLHLLIIKFMLVISFRGSGSCLMLYFLFIVLVLTEPLSVY